MNLKLNNHEFEIFIYDEERPDRWYRCKKCKCEAHYDIDNNEFSSIYYDLKSSLPEEKLRNLTCEEIIIKKIIE